MKKYTVLTTFFVLFAATVFAKEARQPASTTCSSRAAGAARAAITDLDHACPLHPKDLGNGVCLFSYGAPDCSGWTGTGHECVVTKNGKLKVWDADDEGFCGSWKRDQ